MDMPSHIKAALTAVSLSIPIVGGALALGTWQGIYLCEHRRSRHRRRVVVHVGGQLMGAVLGALTRRLVSGTGCVSLAGWRIVLAQGSKHGTRPPPISIEFYCKEH